MHPSQHVCSRPPAWVQFLCGLASQPRKVASLCPSSRSLERRLAGLPCLRHARLVVELGPGLGGTTRALLQAMPKDSQLLGIEIVDQFAAHVRTIPDERLRVVCGCAHDLQRLLRIHRLPRPNVVISGIPFSAMPHRDASSLLRKIYETLPVADTFVSYQVHKRVCELAEEHFGSPRESLILANIPPLRIFEWRKKRGPGP